MSTSFKLAVYYGSGELSALERFERVALQPGHYSSAELKQLKAAGSTPLAYLSLGEDAGSAAPWQRSEKNPDWYGHYVQAGHPGWGEKLRTEAEALLERGFGGFLLDTLDTVDLFPEDRAAYLDLVASIRSLESSAYLLANRGFSLLPELAGFIDGLLFEAFSSTWLANGTTQALSPTDLFLNTEIMTELEPHALDLYALDYADTPALEAFARDRAASHRLTSLISNRELTRLPG